MRRSISTLIVRAYHRLQPWISALEESAAAGEAVTPGIYHYPGFLQRLIEETERARRYEIEFGVVVIQTSAFAHGRQRRRLEVALRDSLRKADVPGRLAGDTLAVLLPETGRGTPAAADRLAALLTRAGGGPVSTGHATYPADSEHPSELIRLAIERSTHAAPLAPALWDGSGERREPVGVE